MGRIILLLSTVLFITVNALGQINDTIYYNRNWNETSQELAGYYRVKTKMESIDTLYWRFQDFYKENDVLQNEGYITQISPEVRHHLWKWYYPNGIKEMEGNYHSNKRVGEWKHYHENGALKKVGSHSSSGKLNGEWNWYYPDSVLMSTAVYNEDTLLDERKWFHPNSKLRLLEYFKYGKLDSIRSEWYTSGVLKSEVNFQEGFKNGVEKLWYENGFLKSEITYKSGIIEQEAWYTMLGDTVPKDSIIDPKENHNLLWKISGKGLKKPSYLFGTMHIKNKEAFEFSDSMLIAFDDVEGYSMEIHPDSLFGYYFSKFDKFKSWNHYGTEVLGESNPTRFHESWGGQNGYSEWIMNLNQVFHRDDYMPDGMEYFVDCYLYFIAHKRGKFTDGIERVKDHVNSGKNLPRNSMRYDILSQFNPADEMLLTYKEGNLEKINALMEFLQNEEFRYRLLTVRNIKMADAIDSLVQIRSTFNTAGTAHLPGDKGLITLLRQKGYSVTPVEAVFSGNKLEDTQNNSSQQWIRSIPYKTDFSVETPGKLQSVNVGMTRNIYLNPIKEIGFDAYQLDERWLTSGVQSTKVEKEDVNYLFNKPLVISSKKIVHQGLRGKEIIWQDESPISDYRSTAKENIFYRSRVFKKDFKISVLTVGSTVKDSLFSEYSDRFFNSVFWNRKQVENVPWEEFSDRVGAFSVIAPSNLKKEFIHYNKPDNSEDQPSSFYSKTKEEKKVHYWHSEDKGNKYIVRYNNAPVGQFVFNDSTVLSDAINYYLKKLSKPTKADSSMFDGFPSVTCDFKPNNKYLAKIRVINRGYRNYMLIALINKDSESINDADNFFKSFEFLPLKQSELTTYTTETDSVSFLLPQDRKEGVMRSYRWFVANRASYKPVGNSSSYDWYFEKVESANKPISAYNNRHWYYGLDSISGVNYQTFVETFSNSFTLANYDTLFNYYTDIFTGETDSVSVSKRSSNNGVNTCHVTYSIGSQNGEGQMRFTQKGQTIVSQRVYYPIGYRDNKNIQQFFDSLDLSLIKDTVDLYQDKSIAVLEQLQTDDLKTEQEAIQKLTFYPFDTSHIQQIYKYVEIETKIDSINTSDNSLELINLLTYVNDSTTPLFMYNYFQKHTDSVDAKFEVLRMMSHLNDSVSYSASLEFVKDSVCNYEKYAEEYQNVLKYFADSLPLFSDNFSVFDSWLRDSVWELETEIYRLANTVFLNDSINPKGILKQKDALINQYHKVASIYDQIDKDTNIYYQVRYNLIHLTELIGWLDTDDDSTRNILLALLEDSNKDLKFAATKALFRGHNTISAEQQADLFSDIKNRYVLMTILDQSDRHIKIPVEYNTALEVSKAQLYLCLSRYSRPIKMKLLDVVKKEWKGEVMKFYVYSYYDDGHSREKKVAVSNPLSLNQKIQFYDTPKAVAIDFDSKNEKELIIEVIEEWISSNPETEEWSKLQSATEE